MCVCAASRIFLFSEGGEYKITSLRRNRAAMFQLKNILWGGSKTARKQCFFAASAFLSVLDTKKVVKLELYDGR